MKNRLIIANMQLFFETEVIKTEDWTRSVKQTCPSVFHKAAASKTSTYKCRKQNTHNYTSTQKACPKSEHQHVLLHANATKRWFYAACQLWRRITADESRDAHPKCRLRFYRPSYKILNTTVLSWSSAKFFRGGFHGDFIFLIAFPLF